MTEEEELVSRARDGDREAFARLASAHRETAYRAAYWVLRDQEDALDATQEAMLRAFKHLGGFDGRAAFSTWLRRIATNVSIDRASRRKRDRMSELPQDDLVSDARAPEVGLDLEREERRRIVREAIDELPPAQKSAVLLRDVEGLSYEEISQALGIPKGTVMSRIFYGRVTLKKRLGERMADLSDGQRDSTTRSRGEGVA